MRDRDCVAFLQWALPRLGLRWDGFRRVRGQIRKRLARRLQELGLGDLDAYRCRLGADRDEWRRLDALCRVTISRFYRDRGVWDELARTWLPESARRASARGERELRCWSAGCASGEEPFTLAIVWQLVVGPRLRAPAPAIRILATDADEQLLERARRGRYGVSSLRDLPAALREQCFRPEGRRFVLDPTLRRSVELVRQDVRVELPDETFDLLLCRNLVFTYYVERLQRELLGRLLARLAPDGLLVVGIHESLPARPAELTAVDARHGLFLRGERR